nr:hypothetical protein [uncultured Rhodopila sp.]
MYEDATSCILAALDRLEAGIGSFRDHLTTTRSDIMERIAGLQKIVTAIQDDIAVNMGAVGAARQANDETRVDLRQMREQMSVMWRQLKAVQARVDEIDGRR